MQGTDQHLESVERSSSVRPASRKSLPLPVFLRDPDKLQGIRYNSGLHLLV